LGRYNQKNKKKFGPHPLITVNFEKNNDSMLPKDLTRDIKTRLATIKGQVDGLIKMLDNGEDPEKIKEYNAKKSQN
jgi:hypothetical protein